jgi:hypothetical protein
MADAPGCAGSSGVAVSMVGGTGVSVNGTVDKDSSVMDGEAVPVV